MEQTWRCTKCGAAGTIVVPPESGVMYGVDLIRNAHFTDRPDCSIDNGTRYVRVNV